MKSYRKALITLLTSVGACSSSDDATRGEVDSDAETVSTSSSDDGAPSSDSEQDVGDTSNGETDDGGVGPAAPLIPLTVGRWWRYEPVGPGDLYSCSGSGPYITEVVGSTELEGVPAAIIRPAFQDGCGFDDVYYEDRGADEYWQFFPAEETKWQRLMVPPEEDLEWEVPGGSWQFRWRWVGEYTVVAGTFSDCWARESNVKTTGVPYVGDYIYCRGVGLVSLDLLFEGGATLELAEFGM